MMKAAVRSAARFDTLAPYCLFLGNRTADVHQWLVAHNVRIIYHNPSWATQIAQILGKENIRTSHLYANPEMAVGTWQRIDIPIVPELEQFEYVLFTVRATCNKACASDSFLLNSFENYQTGSQHRRRELTACL
jgi:hypothetical protein